MFDVDLCPTSERRRLFDPESQIAKSKHTFSSARKPSADMRSLRPLEPESEQPAVEEAKARIMKSIRESAYDQYRSSIKTRAGPKKMQIKILDSQSTELLSSGNYMPRFPMFNDKEHFMHLGKEIGVVIKPTADEVFKVRDKHGGATHEEMFGDNWRAGKVVES
jgi:hypothetical protein